VRDADCAGECANTGECIAAGTSLAVRIRWTVAGIAPTPSNPAPCGDIDHLEVTFSGDGDRQSYAPVPCDAGQITFTRLPPRFSTVRLTAIEDPDMTVDSASFSLESTGETTIAVDFAP
jgi:hypothetical protein